MARAFEQGEIKLDDLNLDIIGNEFILGNEHRLHFLGSRC